MALVLARASETLGEEPFYQEFVAGLERGLRRWSVPVLLHVAPSREHELLCYERWHADGHVQGVVLVDLVRDDPRIDTVRRLGLPAVAVGSPTAGRGLDTVWTQDDRAMAGAVARLVDLGHRRLAHLGGPMSMTHTQVRADAFDRECLRLGAEPLRVEGDYLEVSGRSATTTLLEAAHPPTAVIVDNDIMALGVLGEARSRGVAVPEQLSVLAWDDSSLCQLATPALSAVAHDVPAVGVLTARAMRNALSGRPSRTLTAPAAQVIERETTQFINY